MMEYFLVVPPLESYLFIAPFSSTVSSLARRETFPQYSNDHYLSLTSPPYSINPTTHSFFEIAKALGQLCAEMRKAQDLVGSQRD